MRVLSSGLHGALAAFCNASEVYEMWKPLTAGALAIACGAWAVGSYVSGDGSPPPDTGDPVVVVTSTSAPTPSADIPQADDSRDGEPGGPSAGAGSGDRLNSHQGDPSRPTAAGMTRSPTPVNGQTGPSVAWDDVPSEVEIPRQVEDPDDRDEDRDEDDQNEDDQGGGVADGDDDGGDDD